MHICNAKTYTLPLKQHYVRHS